MLATIAENMLDTSKLTQWLRHYTITNTPKTIGVVMAGNIPLAGFHDFLCVLASGNLFTGKPSHKDPYLLPALAEQLTTINPVWRRRITFADTLPLDAIQAFIATGSDAAARHFGKLAATTTAQHRRPTPALIRHNRRSVALLSGHETPDELQALTDDILAYFGLGCRNVSQLYIPEHYDLQPLATTLAARADIRRHTGYDHNYRYQKTILTMNARPFIDTTAALLYEENTPDAPLATVHFSYYKHLSDALETITQQNEQIQCIVAGATINNKFCTFGTAQRPFLHNYADGTDTMRWLNEL
ncbi:MAG: aldehyde dehydrogenase [Prevotellaceae bacterium]|jgi:hypothetical protein|nr:aldehyde dehydrogenase [Prevotellaceae bacterium]